VRSSAKNDLGGSFHQCKWKSQGLKNERNGAGRADIHPVGAASCRPRLETKLLGTLGVATAIRTAELTKDPNRMKMLRSQAGVSTAGPDVHEVEGPPGDCGQHQGGPEDLAPPFSKAAIDSDHFAVNKETEICTRYRIRFTGSYGLCSTFHLFTPDPRVYTGFFL
jgi:hypothetical protein